MISEISAKRVTRSESGGPLKKYLLFAFYWWLLLPTIIYGQSPLNFERYGIEDGLPVKTVRSLAIDTFGYLWVGTRGGLARFDGKDMVSYEFNPDRPQGMKEGGVIKIVPIGSRYVAFNTVDRGLYLIDRSNGSLTHYPVKEREGETNLGINTLIYLGNDTLYLGGGHKGLLRFPLSDKRYLYPDSTSLNPFGEGTMVCAIGRSSKGGLWLSNTDGLLGHYQPATGKVTLASDEPVFKENGKRIGDIKSIAEGADGSVWFGYRGYGLGRYFPESGKVLQYGKKTPPLNWERWVGNGGLVAGANDALWIKTWDMPYRFVPETNRFEAFPVLVGNEILPPRKASIRGIAVDTSKRRLWLGGVDGLMVADLPPRSSSQATRFLADTSVLDCFGYVSRNPSLPSFMLGKEGEVRWRPPGSYGWSPVRTAEGSKLPAAQEKLFFGNDSTLWYATGSGEQIVRFNWRDKSLISYDRPAALSSSLRGLVVVRDDLLYMGMVDDLYSWNPINGETKRYKKTYFNPSDNNEPYPIFDIDLDAEGMVWIVGYLGAKRLNPNRPRDFKDFAYQQDAPHSLSYNQAFHVAADHQKDIWVGTEMGLNRYRGKGKFDRLLPQHGLPHKQVTGLWPVNTGGVWVMTKLGLGYALADASRVIPIILPVKGCPRIDRVLGLIDGNQLVVTACGITRLVAPPKTDSVAQALQVTGLQYYQESTDSVLQYAEWRAGQPLQLDYSDNSLELNFAPVGQLGDGSLTYQYRILGIQNKWVAHGQKRTVRMAGFSPGKYELQVKTSQPNLAPPLRVPILVAYPWYRSIWFYILAALLLISGIYFTYVRWQARRAAIRDREFRQFQKELYGNIAHELRTPLTLIKAQARQIDKGQEPPVSIRNNINRHVSSMLTLIDQLLRIDQLREARHIVVRQEGDIYARLRENTLQFHSAASAAGINLSIDLPEEPLIIRYSDYAWETIVNNLLSNAIKYAERGDSIVLSACYQKKSLLLTVADTGPGIPEEKRATIFTRYARLNNHRKKMGHGIGLAYVATVLEEIGGTIRVEENTPRGSKFIVFFPCQPVPIEANNQVLSAAREDLPLVLVIEDHREMANYIAKCLQDQYRVIKTNTGATGLEQALTEVPDAIITDLMLPGVDGIEITRKLKADRLTSHIPVLLLTARSLQESRLSGLQAGADAYLTKPFDPEELQIRLATQLVLRNRLRAHYLEEAARARPQVQGKKQRAVVLPPPKKVDLPSSAFDHPGQVRQPNQLLGVELYFLEELKKHIMAHLAEVELNAQMLAPMIAMSRSQLYRKLNALTGLSVNLYIRKIRLAVVAERLLDSTESVKEIAYSTGFSSPKYMSRLFRETYGISPKAYRDGEKQLD